MNTITAWDPAGSSLDDQAIDSPDGRRHAVFASDAEYVEGEPNSRDAFYQFAGACEAVFIGSFPNVDAAKAAVEALMAAGR